MLVVLPLALRWAIQRQRDKFTKAFWDHQIAGVEAGSSTCLLRPEPEFLEEFVEQRPGVAAKITEVYFSMGSVSDERFRYLRRFPHLETLFFYDVWEGADSLLSRLAGMESITALSFSKTRLSDEGMHAVASFPNLKRLDISYVWKDADLRPLSGHKTIETLTLHELPITKEWIDVIASLPKLREVKIEGSGAVESDLDALREAAPKVKVVRGK
jgi:hypothetical protein